MALSAQTTASFCNKNWIITLVFCEKSHFFRRELSKIAQKRDHNINPRWDLKHNYSTVVFDIRSLTDFSFSSVSIETRVTRLGDFLQVGRTFTLATLLKMTDMTQNFWTSTYFQR
jgi:hypothetical protein